MTDMSDNTELKPCPNPWCDSHNYKSGLPKDDDVRDVGSGYLHVQCRFCGLSSPARMYCDEAIEQWNTRQATTETEL